MAMPLCNNADVFVRYELFKAFDLHLIPTLVLFLFIVYHSVCGVGGGGWGAWSSLSEVVLSV